MNKIHDYLKNKPGARELFMYIIFGVLTTAVNWFVYWIVTVSFGLHQYEIDTSQYKLIVNAANVTAWVSSVLFAYYTNKKWVFQSKKAGKTGAWQEFWLFVSSRILSFALFDLGLSNLCLFVLPDFHFVITRDQWIKLIMNVLVVIFNYVASKWVVFRKKNEKDA